METQPTDPTASTIMTARATALVCQRRRGGGVEEAPVDRPCGVEGVERGVRRVVGVGDGEFMMDLAQRATDCGVLGACRASHARVNQQ
jgi:hypothetical protein